MGWVARPRQPVQGLPGPMYLGLLVVVLKQLEYPFVCRVPSITSRPSAIHLHISGNR